jgi:hypothetical protein
MIRNYFQSKSIKSIKRIKYLFLSFDYYLFQSNKPKAVKPFIYILSFAYIFFFSHLD